MRHAVPTLMAMLVAGLWTVAGAASELASFNGAVADIYGHYRQAVFYTRTGNAAVAALELDEFVAGWEAVIEKYGAAPPDAFADDRDWVAALSDVRAGAALGLAALDRGDLEAAADSLAPVRGMLGDLRRRNGVITFSDHVDELSAAMDVLARYRGEVDDLSEDATAELVGRQATIVEYLFDQVRRHAPPSVAGNAEFVRMLDGVGESMTRLRRGLRERDIRLFRIGSGELRSHERMLFLRFG